MSGRHGSTPRNMHFTMIPHVSVLCEKQHDSTYTETE